MATHSIFANPGSTHLTNIFPSTLDFPQKWKYLLSVAVSGFYKSKKSGKASRLGRQEDWKLWDSTFVIWTKRSRLECTSKRETFNSDDSEWSDKSSSTKPVNKFFCKARQELKHHAIKHFTVRKDKLMLSEKFYSEAVGNYNTAAAWRVLKIYLKWRYKENLFRKPHKTNFWNVWKRQIKQQRLATNLQAVQMADPSVTAGRTW